MNRVNVYLLALGAFLVGTAELVVAGILNVIADDLRISIALAGQLITAYSLAFAIGTPILVAFTSRMARKKLLVLSLAIFIIGCLASWGSTDYPILMVSRLILGVSAGVYTVVAVSSVAKLVPADKMGSAIGMIALGFGSAMALGVPIGIAISHWWSWQVIFVGLGVLSLLIMLALIRLLPHVEGDAPVSWKQQFTVLANPVIVSGLLISLFLCMSNSIMLTYLAPFLQTVLQLNTSDLGIMMFALGIFGVIGSRLGGFGADKWGSVRMISFTLAICAVSLAVLPVMTASLAVGLALITIWFSAIFMNAPALQTYFIQQAPQSSNLVLSLNLSIIHVGLAIGAGAGGVVVDATSTVLYHPWMASGAVAFGLAAALVSFMLRKRHVSDMVRDVDSASATVQGMDERIFSACRAGKERI